MGQIKHKSVFSLQRRVYEASMLLLQVAGGAPTASPPLRHWGDKAYRSHLWGSQY